MRIRWDVCCKNGSRPSENAKKPQFSNQFSLQTTILLALSGRTTRTLLAWRFRQRTEPFYPVSIRQPSIRGLMDQENLRGHIPSSVSTLTWHFPKICVTRRLESPGTLHRMKPLARVKAAFD